MSSGTKEATLPLDTGMLYIAWPENIRPDEIEDVENWMQMMIRKMKRSAAEVNPKQWLDHMNEDPPEDDQGP